MSNLFKRGGLSAVAAMMALSGGMLLGAEGTSVAGASSGDSGCPDADESVDAELGAGAGVLYADLQCAAASPLAAEGEPLVIGFQTMQGDPQGSFPESANAAQAAVEFINAELGGLGADLRNGVPGRPIELRVCPMAVVPDDSQRCANDLVSADPFLVVSSLNFFGNHLPIYEAAGTPTIGLTPLTIGDYTSSHVISIGGGGGCLGAHTGLVEFATADLGARRAAPWADTPGGVACYYDLEAKPLEVLNGSVEGTGERAGSLPDLEYLGVPVVPATPDMTPMATQILDYEPDAIIYSATANDCMNMVTTLHRLGWDQDEIPMVMTSPCADQQELANLGEDGVGLYFIMSGAQISAEPSTIVNDVARFEAELYREKAIEYGLADADLLKSYATQGFSGLMNIWVQSVAIAADGGDLTGESLVDAFRATDNSHAFGSTPLSCATAPAPYTAVCNATVSAMQWDGEKMVPVRERFSGLDLIAGTELRPGP